MDLTVLSASLQWCGFYYASIMAGKYFASIMAGKFNKTSLSSFHCPLVKPRPSINHHPGYIHCITFTQSETLGQIYESAFMVSFNYTIMTPHCQMSNNVTVCLTDSEQIWKIAPFLQPFEILRHELWAIDEHSKQSFKAARCFRTFVVKYAWSWFCTFLEPLFSACNCL